MLVRVWTSNGCLDVEVNKPLDVDKLSEALSNQDTIQLTTKNETSMFINSINIVAIEVVDLDKIDTPPIS